jgi:hypothetical protein
VSKHDVANGPADRSYDLNAIPSTRPSTGAFRDGWERVWGSKHRRSKLKPICSYCGAEGAPDVDMVAHEAECPERPERPRLTH